MCIRVRNVSPKCSTWLHLGSWGWGRLHRREGRFPDTYGNFKEVSFTSHRGCSALVSVISVSSPFPLETLKRVSLTTVPLSVALLCGCAWRILATQTPKAAHREQLQSGCFALCAGRAEDRREHPGDRVRWAQADSPWPPRRISAYYPHEPGRRHRDCLRCSASPLVVALCNSAGSK